MKPRLNGRCAECNTYSRELFAVPDDDPGRDGKPMFRYVCRLCWRGGPDPFDDPSEADVDRATEADLR